MNLKLTRELLSAANDQPHGTFHVEGRDEAREVELLVDAGYVVASIDQAKEVPTAVIERVTDAGRKLLNVLRPS